MPIKWIICDIDGCLSPEESIPWNLDHFGRFAAISRAASAGMGPVPPITLCTGRPQPYAEVLAKILDIRAPIICENGAVIYNLHDNRSVYGPGVTPEKIRGLRAVRAFIETEILAAFPGVIIQFGKEAQMSIFSERPEVFADVRPRIEQFARETGAPELVIDKSYYYLNISLAGVNKGNTLTQLLDTLGVTRDEAAGVGDTEGDIPLRNAVGFFACPSNARASLQALADYVAPYPDIEGLLDILQHPRLTGRA
jgi:HAD superfamily hydrolase (TIGR01484 family)